MARAVVQSKTAEELLHTVSLIGLYHTNQIPQIEPGSPTPRAFSSSTIRTVGEVKGTSKTMQQKAHQGSRPTGGFLTAAKAMSALSYWQ